MTDASTAFARLSEIGRRPEAYIDQWRSEHPDRKVVGVLPMNFPRELAHAVGVLPAVIQDDQQPVSEGRSLLPEFYCGYTRNLADQAATDRLARYDAVFMADHCIQLVGAADVVRTVLPEKPVFFGMLNTSMHDPWAPQQIRDIMATFRSELESVAGDTITDEALRSSIRAHNRDRQLIRRLFDERTAGSSAFTPGQLRDIVVSSMVMDPAEHHALLEQALESVQPAPRDDRVRVHLSGHLCHAPNRGVLEAIEECGALVVDDDLYHGRRYVSTDVDETVDPLDALGLWYTQRNVTIPCPTRVQKDVDWDTYLVDSVQRSGAEAVVHLVPKFCEPHMLYYPELRKALDSEEIPQLQLETEHEGMPLESFRTRIEALVERIRRGRPVPA